MDTDSSPHTVTNPPVSLFDVETYKVDDEGQITYSTKDAPGTFVEAHLKDFLSLTVHLDMLHTSGGKMMAELVDQFFKKMAGVVGSASE